MMFSITCLIGYGMLALRRCRSDYLVTVAYLLSICVDQYNEILDRTWFILLLLHKLSLFEIQTI